MSERTILLIFIEDIGCKSRFDCVGLALRKTRKNGSVFVYKGQTYCLASDENIVIWKKEART